MRALRRDGHEVAVLNRGRRPERLPAGIRTLVCDRTDHAALRRTLAGERVDALVDITYAPTTGADVKALLEALAGRIGHAVFVSSCRVYDHARPIPFDEETPRTFYWGEYAKHKTAGEESVDGMKRGRQNGRLSEPARSAAPCPGTSPERERFPIVSLPRYSDADGSAGTQAHDMNEMPMKEAK